MTTSRTGDHRCHGEERMDDCPSNLKSMLEPSVRKDNPSTTGLRPEPGCELEATGCARHGYAGLVARRERRSAPSGAKSTTYRTTGCFGEHENLDPRAKERCSAASRQVR